MAPAEQSQDCDLEHKGRTKAKAVPTPEAEADLDYFTASHYGPRKKKFKVRREHPLSSSISLLTAMYHFSLK